MGDIAKITKAVTDLKNIVEKISTQKNNALVIKLNKYLEAVERKKVTPSYAAKYLNDILFKEAPLRASAKTLSKEKKEKKLVAVFMSEENIEPMVKRYFKELKSKQIIDSLI